MEGNAFGTNVKPNLGLYTANGGTAGGETSRSGGPAGKTGSTEPAKAAVPAAPAKRPLP